jgi:hypothetical protein
MNSSMTLVRTTALVAALSLTACGGAGGGSGGGGGGGGNSTPPPGSADEVTDPSIPFLSNRVSGTAQSVYVVFEGQSVRLNDSVTINYADGVVTGGLLSGTDLDNSEFTNPARGEHSRIVRISGSNVFGAVGIDATLPPGGTVTTNYNEGWVGLTAAIDGDDTYTLEGDAVFTATWGSNRIDGRFLNLSGNGSVNGAVSDVGTILISDARIVGDNFDRGTVTGTGLFDDLGGTGSSRTLRGSFFGPQADELGGVLVVNDSADGILVVGAFQAD